MMNHLSRDPVTIKGVLGSILMGITEVVVHNLGPLIGVLSGILGLYLVMISIIQKHREMKKWNETHKK